jgi:uracil phosphoribosyltransferase
VKHPLVEHSLAVLRDRSTPTAAFRLHAGIVSKIMLVEATRGLPLAPRRVETPLTSADCSVLAEPVVVVPVLRAGLAMLFAAQDLLPQTSVGFLGLERDEQTALAHEYYQKLPPLQPSHRVLVLDPMLATGGSLDATIAALRAKGAARVAAVCIVAAPEGIRRLAQAHPAVSVVTAAVDAGLDANKFIVPGLGDFGDRYFGT